MRDLFIFIAVTLTFAGVALYGFVQTRIAFLKKNWVEYRCNPIYMPFASLVGQSTITNFTQCTMKSFHDYLGFVMDPIMGEFSIVNDTISEISDTLGSMRSMFSGVRGGFLGIVGSVFGKIQNLMSQTQYIMIRMRTLLARVVGVMYSLVYTFYSGMETGEAVMNGPIGKTVSMLCFAETTPIQIWNGRMVNISDLLIGMRLRNGATVTSVYNFGETDGMYCLDGIYVTGSHKVLHNNKFICVENHPRARKTNILMKIACINTDIHRIAIKNHIFLDFVETTSPNFMDFKRIYIESVFNSADTGKVDPGQSALMPQTLIPTNMGFKEISKIKVNDILDTGDKVLGVVRHYVSSNTLAYIDEGILVTPQTWLLQNNTVTRKHPHKVYVDDGFIGYQLITETNIVPVYSSTGKRYLLLDELETDEEYFYKVKDRMIENQL